MTGYYPCPQDEELVISSTATSIAMHLEGSNLGRERKRLLGSEEFGFGGIMPSHCRALQANVPTVAGLTDEAILDGSAYHIVAPTYSTSMREKLLNGIFDGYHRQFRQIFPGHRVPHLQYCVECARDDDKQGNRQCWRVLANIPGNNTCVKHGVLLTTTGAISSGASIPPDAAQWIDLQSPSIRSRNKYDVQLAKDLQWLYQRKSRLCPGWQNLSAALTIVLAKRPEYRRSRHFLQVDAIVNDLGKISEIAKRLAPRLRGPKMLARILYKERRASIPLYSLLGLLVGADLKSLFELACDPAIGQNPYTTLAAYRTRYRKMKGPNRLKEMKASLKKYWAENPGASRTQLSRDCSQEVFYVRRHDANWYAKKMPGPIRGFTERRPLKIADKPFPPWLLEVLAGGKGVSRIIHVGDKTALKIAKLFASRSITALARLPNTSRKNLLRRSDNSLPSRDADRKKGSLRCK